jgi:hypothetical protein
MEPKVTTVLTPQNLPFCVLVRGLCHMKGWFIDFIELQAKLVFSDALVFIYINHRDLFALPWVQAISR